MFVRFIAHAGISITEGGTHVLIDPWLSSSSVSQPLLEGVLGRPTIDFQTPRSYLSHRELAPVHGVFVSHFHTHHSPKKDILTLLSLSPNPVSFGSPALTLEQQVMLESLFTPINPTVTVRGFAHSESICIGPFTITAYTHTVPYHLAWHVTSPTGSVLHISDAHAHTDPDTTSLHELWRDYARIQPDLLFINASGNSLQILKDGKASLRENACMSPAQAVLLTQIINPKAVSLIGSYNRSIWNGQNEYVRPSSVIEEEFYWALRWVNPNTKCIFSLPGHTFGIREDARNSDTFIVGD